MRIEMPRMSAAEFFEWAQRPENAVKRSEYDRGCPAAAARPADLHGAVRSNVDYILGGYARRRSRGLVSCVHWGSVWDEPHDSARGPNLFFYDERPRLADLASLSLTEAPILVVEVLWPRENIWRVLQLLRWGVKLVWVVHPEDRTVTVYSGDRAPAVLGRREELTGGDALPDFRCRVEEFFYTTGDDPG